MKKLIIVVLFALLATACGSSDGTDQSATDNEAAEVADSDQDGTGDTAGDDTADGTADEAAEDTADGTFTPPAPVEVVRTFDRDCTHSTTADVELPVGKPVVDEQYLGEFDEINTIDLIVGTGAEAGVGIPVTMQYVGVLASDGTQFDASWDGGGAFPFTLGGGQVIAGWDEGIVGMKVGGRRVLQVPSELAYGDQDRSEIIVANSDLVFIVDLVGTTDLPQPAPAIDAQYLGEFDELQTVDIVQGDGCTAETGDIVRVHYVGVNADDGEEFDSSWSRGETFSLIVGRAQVIDGWNEGIAGMKVGGERILQLPADLAYGDGDLVFLVALEDLQEAPVAHQVELGGDAPDEVEVTTLVEGSGDTAEAGSIIDAQLVVMLYSSNVIVQSTYSQGAPQQLALSEGALLPGLENAIVGTKVGETRQIVIPPDVAYPDGVPENSGLTEDDALVFIVELLRVTPGA